MKGPQTQYTDEMKKHFGYYAAWEPGIPIEIGDVGTLSGNVFTRHANLRDLEVDIETAPNRGQSTDLQYTSNGSVNISTKLSGAVPATGSSLSSLDLGISIEFGKEFATLFKADKTTSPSIRNTIKLGEDILKLFKDGKWDKNWRIVTEVIVAESASVIISNSTNSKVELKANGNINAVKIDIADAAFNFSAVNTRGINTMILAQKGMTPLFKLMGIKTRILQEPVFATRGIKAIDLITPDSIQTIHKDLVYFGHITEEITE
ncbi:MAG: hypothetical protein JWO03_1715 [Bacteroidetes bacterium]|nr:hypothetical protein [Bacteroidota bacterium]